MDGLLMTTSEQLAENIKELLAPYLHIMFFFDNCQPAELLEIKKKL